MRKPNKKWWQPLLFLVKSFAKEEVETTEEKMIYEAMLQVSHAVEDLLYIL